MRYAEVVGHGGSFWIQEAGLGLGLWQGSYHGEERLWLRWRDTYGAWIPTDSEQAEQAQSRAEQERKMKEAALLRETQLRLRVEQAEHLAEQERQRAERMAELLRQPGHDPDQIERQ